MKMLCTFFRKTKFKYDKKIRRNPKELLFLHNFFAQKFSQTIIHKNAKKKRVWF